MQILIAYDVATTDKHGRRRLRRIAKACEGHGQRVQYSLFECDLTPTEWARLKLRLLDEFEEEEDSLRFYFIASDDWHKTEHHGVKAPLNLDGPLIF